MSKRTLVISFPVDFHAIAQETGMSRGKLCHTSLGWVVQNTSGNPDWPDVACVTEPMMPEGATLLTVENDHWCFWK